jgi:hypothetical protein
MEIHGGGGAEFSGNVISFVDISLRSNDKCNYFDVAVGLVWSNDPESYAGGGAATGRASHATQVKSDDPHNKG